MSAAAGFLEFFILEASDYVEQLDGLLLGGGSVGPDGEAMQRAARALRGTATMAKLPAFAELAAGVERVGRAMQDGLLRWDPALAGAVVAAIDDLKSLLHAARAWSPAEDRRARERAARARALRARAGVCHADEYEQRGGGRSNLRVPRDRGSEHRRWARAPDGARRAIRTPRRTCCAESARSAAWLASRRLVRWPTRSSRPRTRRAGSRSSREELSPDARRLLEAAAGYLRTLSAALRAGGDVNAPNPTRDAFEAARTAVESHDAEREHVVPIAKLFYEDGSAGVRRGLAAPSDDGIGALSFGAGQSR